MEKNVTGVNCNVFRVFLGEPLNFLRQQCSWLNQRKSVMFRAESVFFRNDRRENQLFSELIQHCSALIFFEINTMSPAKNTNKTRLSKVIFQSCVLKAKIISSYCMRVCYFFLSFICQMIISSIMQRT